MGKIWSTTKKKSSVKNAYRHWKKHGKEFSELQNAKQYVEEAQRFFSNPNALSRVRSDGAYLRYDPLSNVFGSYSSKGVLKTFYKPTSKGIRDYSTPLEYFYGQ